jgi:hypothetical protein
MDEGTHNPPGNVRVTAQQISGRRVHMRWNGRPACGYHRWLSEIITSTSQREKVTCRRCLALPPASGEIPAPTQPHKG